MVGGHAAEIEERRGVEHRLGLRRVHPGLELVAPRGDRPAPARVPRHVSAGARGKAQALQRVSGAGGQAREPRCRIARAPGSPGGSSNTRPLSWSVLKRCSRRPSLPAAIQEYATGAPPWPSARSSASDRATARRTRQSFSSATMRPIWATAVGPGRSLQEPAATRGHPPLGAPAGSALARWPSPTTPPALPGGPGS